MSYTNKNYTKLWTDDDFNNNRVEKYNDKFKNKWEKNIKHCQQVALIKKYISNDMYWCDFPIGSGRLMDELQTDNMMGLDISDSFLQYNMAKGRHCEKADLLNHDHQNQFDLVTSMHTIAAFSDGEVILEGYIKSLKKNGVLIVDIPNQFSKKESATFNMTKQQIELFFTQHGCDVLEMRYHDFWDHPDILQWRAHDSRLKRELWWLVNRCYFSKIKLLAKSTYKALSGIEKLFGTSHFTKILVVAKKKASS